MRTISRPRHRPRPICAPLLFVAILAACQRSPAVPVATRTGPGLITGPAASQGPGDDGPGDDHPAYYVASPIGIVLLDTATLEHGKPPRMLSMTPARWPRLIAGEHERPSGHALVFLAPVEEGTQIRRLEVSTGDERVLATLPRGLGAECGLDAQAQVAGGIHQDRDFTVLADGSAACLVVRDRHEESVAIGVRVDLRAGTFEQLVLRSSTCPAVEQLPPAMGCHSVAAGQPPAAAPAPAPARDEAGFPYRADDGALVHLGAGGSAGTRVPVADLVPELVSSSGRWQLCSGAAGEGGARPRRLVLLDRSQGGFYPLHGGDWPDPVPAAALAGLLASGDDTVTVTSRDPIRALDGDRILAGSLLVIPGKRILDIEGELAR